MFKQPPLKIDCDELSKKLIADLADRLCLCFENVKVWTDEIECSKPLSMFHYGEAWNVLDRFGVKVE